MRRKLMGLPLAAVLLVALILSGCGGSATPTATAGKAEPTKPAASQTTTTGTTPTAVAVTPTSVVKTGGKLSIGTSADSIMNNMDGGLPGARTEAYWLAPIYESLLGHDMKTFEVVPRLAEKFVTSADGLAVTLTLRKGVKWHNVAPVNGREFTADDVKWSIERTRDSKQRSQWQSSLAVVSEVQVVDKYTVKIVLKNPYAPLISMLADNSFMMYPRELAEAYGDKQYKAAIGTGPFMFKSYETDVAFRLVKNPDYWEAGKPRLDEIEIIVIKDSSARMAALRSGQVNYLDSLSKDSADNLMKTAPDLQLFPHAGYAFGIRMQTIGTVFKDVKVRKALNLAVDRQQLISLGAAGQANIMGYFRPEVTPAGVYRTPAELIKLPGYRTPKTEDIAEAKKLLAEAGFANGLTIEASVFKDDALVVKMNEILVEQLKPFGITWKLNLYDYATIGNQLVTDGKFQAAVWYETGGDADKAFGDYQSTQQKAKLLGVGDPALDKLLDAGRIEGDQTKRTAIYRQVEDKLQAELYYRVLLFEMNNFLVISPKLKEVQPMFGAPFQFFNDSWKSAWWDK